MPQLSLIKMVYASPQIGYPTADDSLRLQSIGALEPRGIKNLAPLCGALSLAALGLLLSSAIPRLLFFGSHCLNCFRRYKDQLAYNPILLQKHFFLMCYRVTLTQVHVPCGHTAFGQAH